MSIYLMAKDIPVLKTEGGKCKVLREDLLPFNIRKQDVTLDDFYGNWMNSRAIQLSRTNSKMILNSVRVSQSNAYAICKACHGLSLTDMYWFKEEESDLTWKEVNLYHNPISKAMASTALVGDVLRETGKIHTPELTTQGVTAKAWVKNEGETWLYKIGKKELAASEILDALQIRHVKYEKVVSDELDRVVTPERKEMIEALGEEVVKCKLITDEEKSMVNFEDFQIYCENQGLNVFQEIFSLDRRHYLEMQVADYIMNNVDRHAANWGFFMDNNTGNIVGLYPLLDHDHAFSDVEGMLSLTTEQEMNLLTAAMLGQAELQIDLEPILKMSCPEGLSVKEWEAVKNRTVNLKEKTRIYLNILQSGYEATWALVNEMENLKRIEGKEVTLQEVVEKYNSGVSCNEVENKIIKELLEQLSVKHAVENLEYER